MKLSILTWNVWFDRFAAQQRFQSILSQTLTLGPDVACFQEVVPLFISTVYNTPEFSELYDISDDGSGASIRPYGVLMMVKKSHAAQFEFYDMPTNMGRRLLVADLPIYNMKIGTVHLESLNQHRLREQQLILSKRALRSRENAILCGDFNFCSYRNFHSRPGDKLENESLAEILPEYIDIWSVLRPGEPGYTFDSEVNPMIHQYEQMRYDRVIARLQQGVGATSIRLMGMELIHD
ncbi:unnamed protein product, partial [Heterosigma akashiwo]